MVFLLAIITAALGFGHEITQEGLGPNPSLLPAGSFDRLITGLAKVLSVVFLLCFVVSVFVREHLNDGDR